MHTPPTGSPVARSVLVRRQDQGQGEAGATASAIGTAAKGAVKLLMPKGISGPTLCCGSMLMTAAGITLLAFAIKAFIGTDVPTAGFVYLGCGAFIATAYIVASCKSAQAEKKPLPWQTIALVIALYTPILLGGALGAADVISGNTLGWFLFGPAIAGVLFNCCCANRIQQKMIESAKARLTTVGILATLTNDSTFVDADRGAIRRAIQVSGAIPDRAAVYTCIRALIKNFQPFKELPNVKELTRAIDNEEEDLLQTLADRYGSDPAFQDVVGQYIDLHPSIGSIIQDTLAVMGAAAIANRARRAVAALTGDDAPDAAAADGDAPDAAAATPDADPYGDDEGTDPTTDSPNETPISGPASATAAVGQGRRAAHS